VDRYDERIIIGKTEAGQIALLVLSILVAVIGAVLLLIIPPIGLLVLAAGIAASVYVKDGLSIEYEYILTNGDIEVSKIAAKKRRKTVKEIEATKVTKIEYASNDSVKNDISIGKSKVKRYLAPEEDGKVVAVYSGEGDNSEITLLDLNDKCIDHLKAIYKTRCLLK